MKFGSALNGIRLRLATFIQQRMSRYQRSAAALCWRPTSFRSSGSINVSVPLAGWYRPHRLELWSESDCYCLSKRQDRREAVSEIPHVSSQNDLALQVERVGNLQPASHNSFAGFD
jgi:hypothetical protein